MLQKLNIQFLISYFGIFPFIYILLDKYFFYQIKEEIISNFIIYYSLIILVFIGSINWDLRKKIPVYLALYGAIPSFFALIIILMNLFQVDFLIIKIFLIIFFILQLILDYYLIHTYVRNKNAYFYLRVPLSFLICIFIIFI